MGERQDDASDGALERRARAVFDASVDGLDAETRSRLGRARRTAVAELESRRRPAWQWWVPAAAVAVLAMLVAVLVWRAPESTPTPMVQAGNGVTVDALELVAAGDDFDLVTEDLGFYEWLDEVVRDEMAGQGSTT